MSSLSPAAILFDTAGAEKGVDGNPVVVTGVVSSGERDSFGSVVGASRYNQIEVDFSTTDPDAIDRITVTKTNGGDAALGTGQAVFSTSTSATGRIQAVSVLTVKYRPQSESYAAFTCIFTAGTANSYQRLGIYNASDGFFIGFEGTSFGVTLRKGGVDTTTARASFNLDTLTGAAGSKYARAGVPESLDPTKDNLYRIRYGWLGAAPIVFEVFSPDGEWVPFHVIRHPNTVAATTVNNPNLPLTLDAQKTAGATNITMSTACWAAGSTSDLAEITSTLTDTALAKLTRSVITGQTTGGGGGFVNVKVTPSGALTVEANDGGGSLTVDGTVVANQGTPNTTANRWPVQLTDGTDLTAVAAASTAAQAADPALVVGLSPNSPLPAGKNLVGGMRLYDYNDTPIKSTVSSELKIAQLYTLADLTNKYELDDRLYDRLTASGGTVTHVPEQSAVRVSVTGASGSTAALCSNTFYKYQSAYTQFISMSVINSDAGQANQVRSWGYFDDDNGLFFRLSGTALAIVERTDVSGSPVDTAYAQGAWNVDPLNGTGPSGVTLDVSKGNIFEIEFQWFGVGTTRYFVNGILVHQVRHANALTTVYMRTANLPVQTRIVNTGASSAGSLTLVCARVAAQGQNQEPHEWVYGVANPADKLLSVSEVPILSIRPKALYNGIVNRSWVIPHHMTVSTEDYKISYKLIANATLTGASWTSVDARSATEYDVSATAYSGGELLSRSFVPQTGTENMPLDRFFRINGRMLRRAGFAGTGTGADDILTIVAVNEAVGNTKVRADLAWTEVR